MAEFVQMMMAEFIQFITSWIDWWTAWASDPANSNLVRTLVPLLGIPGVLVGMYGFYKLVRGKHTDARVDRANEKLDAQSRKLDELNVLVRQLTADRKGAVGPEAEQAVTIAITGAQQDAAAGDLRLQRALDLLKANKIVEAEAVFRAVAEEKAARIKLDRKDAATAFRNLGAIAGLGDPKRALDAYVRAVELDPDDLDSMLWVGWIQLGRGYLNDAETTFRHILAATKTDDRAYYQYWARLGLGDIRKDRGDLGIAKADYRAAGAIADRLARADPGNAGWQRDLS